MRAYYLSSVDSTNEAAKRLIADGSVESTAYVLAREQTEGKGTQGRRWHSPNNAGIYLTVIHANREEGFPATSAYALSAGIACVEALSDAACPYVRIKPVNDLWVEGRKLGGILTETMVQRGTVTALITGVGINTLRADRPVASTAAPPVCLEECMDPYAFQRFELIPFVNQLAAKIDRWHRVVMNGGVASMEATWLRYALPGSRLPRG